MRLKEAGKLLSKVARTCFVKVLTIHKPSLTTPSGHFSSISKGNKPKIRTCVWLAGQIYSP